MNVTYFFPELQHVSLFITSSQLSRASNVFQSLFLRVAFWHCQNTFIHRRLLTVRFLHFKQLLKIMTHVLVCLRVVYADCKLRSRI